MAISARIPTPLRRLTNGQDKAEIEGSTIKECIAALEHKFPGIEERLCDETGHLRTFVNIYLNGEDIRFLDGMDTPVNSGDEISIVPAVAGG